MSTPELPKSIDAADTRYLAGLLVWVAGWVAMLLLDGPLDLSALGMLLVLTAVLATLWLPLPLTLLLAVVSVMAFNWMFVPPRGTFAINLQHHAVLLLVMVVLSSIVAALMTTLRTQARFARQQAAVADALRAWGDRLRDADDVRSCLPELQQRLQQLAGSAVTLLVLRAGLPLADDMEAVEQIGPADKEQTAGLWYCLRHGQTLGPDSGRYQDLADTYLPLRGRYQTYGATLFHADKAMQSSAVIQHAQDLCDRMGAALERQRLHAQHQLKEKAAQEQELRALLLAAIAHEYRTPLATILGAASSLQQQSDKLDADQQQVLSGRIVDETLRLRQMTSNILQLARLDAAEVQLRCDWETAEELIGSLLQRLRSHEQSARLQTRVEPGLPLLWCDALLLAQLLDNLVDNAFKYSSPNTAIRIGARRAGESVVLYVCDAGPGIPAEAQAAIFQAYKQGQILAAKADTATQQGVGIGLALCRVICTAHGGTLRLVSEAGGSCFECSLPLHPQPQQPAPDIDAEGATA